MKQHNASDERKCWNSKRERDRLRARFQIRERVSSLSHGIEEQSPPSCELSIENISDKEHELLSNVLVYIRKGDRSKLSLTLIDRHFDILSRRIPMEVLQAHLPHTLQLCTAWFGREYSKTLEGYIRSLESFTFMEYAVWMGKGDVVGSLLIGGINPCVRGVYLATNSTEETTTNWDEEMWRTGSKVLVRFFDSFPLPLSSYIVKRVVEMRLEAYKGNHFRESEVCPLSGQLACPGVLLQFKKGGDVFSEPCFWEHLLSHIDSMGSNEDVVTNPCGAWKVNDQDVTIVETTQLSPTQKRLVSLERFHSLPVNGKELKSKGKKKKKKVAVANSWFNAILPSLGSSQDVRRDKFFSYIDRNAIQYIKACIVAGVDLEWKNEYGQTALYICIWRGYVELAKILVNCGASLSAVANGGSSVFRLLEKKKINLGEFEKHLEKSQPCDDFQIIEESFLHAGSYSEPKPATLLIPKESNHPGAGSFAVDHAFSPSQVDLLLELCQSLPLDLDQKKKDTPCSDRSYYCDAEGYVRQVLENVVSKAVSAFSDQVVVFPHMRFLMYKEKGTILAPHVDLCRIDHSSGRRSSHTFIAYLTDNDYSGETTLLGDVSGEGRLKIMARIAPQRGKLLVFPHACPHEGNEVDQVPKIILRGEVIIPQFHNE